MRGAEELGTFLLLLLLFVFGAPTMFMFVAPEVYVRMLSHIQRGVWRDREEEEEEKGIGEGGAGARRVELVVAGYDDERASALRAFYAKNWLLIPRR